MNLMDIERSFGVDRRFMVLKYDLRPSCYSCTQLLSHNLIISLPTQNAQPKPPGYSQIMLKARTQKAMMTNKCEFLIRTLPHIILTIYSCNSTTTKNFYLTNARMAK